MDRYLEQLMQPCTKASIPKFEEPISEPVRAKVYKVNGYNLKRVTDPNFSPFKNNSSLRHVYSVTSPCNSTNVNCMMGQYGESVMLTVRTLKPYAFKSMSAPLLPSKVKSEIRYGIWRQQAKVVKTVYDFKKLTANETYPFDFKLHGYEQADLEGDHNEPSSKDLICYHAKKTNNPNVWLCFYDAINNVLTKEVELQGVLWSNNYSGNGGLRWKKISTSGKYVVLGYYQAGTAFNQGTWVHEIANFNNKRQLNTKIEHCDVGYNLKGEEVLVAFGSYNGNNLVETRLSDGAVTGAYLPNTINPAWGHITMRCWKRKGYAVVSLDGKVSSAKQGNANLLIAIIPLDNSNRWLPVCHSYNYNDDNKYEIQTQVSADNNLNYLFFATNWGGRLNYAYGTTFLVDINAKRKELMP